MSEVAIARAELTAHRPTVDGQVTTPCERCRASGLECVGRSPTYWTAPAYRFAQVIGSSNRGGRRVRKRTLEQANLADNSAPPPRESPAIGAASEQAQFAPQNPSPTRARSGWSHSGYGQAEIGIGIDLNPSAPDEAMLDPALQPADSSVRAITSKVGPVLTFAHIP